MIARWLLAAISTFAADLSGTWTLVVPQSDFGGATPPQGQQVTVRQTGDILNVHSVLTDHRGETKSSYAIDASGNEVENVIRGNRVVSVANWKKAVLEVKSETSVQNIVIRTVDEWQLAGEAGLVIARSAVTPKGELKQRFVYEKALVKR